MVEVGAKVKAAPRAVAHAGCEGPALPGRRSQLRTSRPAALVHLSLEWRVSADARRDEADAVFEHPFVGPQFQLDLELTGSPAERLGHLQIRSDLCGSYEIDLEHAGRGGA